MDSMVVVQVGTNNSNDIKNILSVSYPTLILLKAELLRCPLTNLLYLIYIQRHLDEIIDHVASGEGGNRVITLTTVTLPTE